jgi:hypothetical protein
MHQCGSRCKINKHIGNMDFSLLYLSNNMRLDIQSHEGGSKKFKSSVIFELISSLLSFLYLCNQQSLLLK